jgi:hypothetical protein
MEATCATPSGESPRPHAVLDAAVVLLAAWTLYSHALVFSGASFDTLLRWSFVPPVLGAGLLCWLRGGPRAAASSASAASVPPQLVLAGVAAAAVAMLSATGVWTAFWVLALAIAAVLWRTSSATAPRVPEARAGPVALGIAIVIAVTVTLCAHRPDSDDALYLNVAVTALDHPSEPLLAADGMHGEADLPFLSSFYRLPSYELLVAAAAAGVGRDPADVYYVWTPALGAALAILAIAAALSALGARAPVLALFVALLALLAWGDGHKTIGNFSFVRLFQGKALLATALVPAIVTYAARFLDRPDSRGWARLAAAQIGALGLSATGLVVAPLAAALALASGLAPGALRAVAAGGTASFYLPLAGLMAFLEAEPPTRFARENTVATTFGAVGTALGHGIRGDLALLALLASPALASDARSRRRLAAIAVGGFLLLNPWLAPALDHLQDGTGWRLLWAIPFPLLIALLVDGLVAIPRTPLPAWVAARLAAVVVGATFLLAPAPWTTSAANRTFFARPGVKQGPGRAVARAAVDATPADGAILAPGEIASWIPTIRHHPRVVVVRSRFLQAVARGRGTAEAEERLRLQRHLEVPRQVGSTAPEPESAGRWFAGEVRRRQVDTVVVPIRLPWYRATSRALRASGFVRRPSGAYEIWTRAKAAKPAG